jgi:hypothetical protein
VHTFFENQAKVAGEHQEAIALPQLASGSYILVIASSEGKVSIVPGTLHTRAWVR